MVSLLHSYETFPFQNAQSEKTKWLWMLNHSGLVAVQACSGPFFVRYTLCCEPSVCRSPPTGHLQTHTTTHTHAQRSYTGLDAGAGAGSEAVCVFPASPNPLKVSEQSRSLPKQPKGHRCIVSTGIRSPYCWLAGPR